VLTPITPLNPSDYTILVTAAECRSGCGEGKHGLDPHVSLLLGLDEATVLDRGRLAVVLSLLVFLDFAPSVGQLLPPRRRRHPCHRRGRRRHVISAEEPGAVLGFRRGGDCASARNRGVVGLRAQMETESRPRTVQRRRQVLW
jgi:hypothetical protein